MTAEMHPRLMVLINYLVNFAGSIRQLELIVKVPSSTMQSWISEVRVAKNPEQIEAFARAYNGTPESVWAYLRGEITIEECIGPAFNPRHMKPRRRRAETIGIRRKQSNSRRSKEDARPVRTVAQQEIPMPRVATTPTEDDDGMDFSALVAALTLTQRVRLMQALVELIGQDLTGTTTPTPQKPSVPQWLAGWLRSHLEEQGVPRDTYTRQVVAVLRRRMNEAEAIALADGWIEGRSLPDADGLECLSLVLRDADGIPIDIRKICEVCYDGDYPNSEIARICQPD